MSNWCVYLLASNTGRTYVGSTTNPHRRLRQHNGEIAGGARSTRGHTWRICIYLSGFQNRSVACRWEKIVKSRARGLKERSIAMSLVHQGKCPEYKGRPEYDTPYNLTLHVLEFNS